MENTIRIFKFVWEILPTHHHTTLGMTNCHQKAPAKIGVEIFTQHKKTRRKSIGFLKPYRVTSRKPGWDSSVRKFDDNNQYVTLHFISKWTVYQSLEQAVKRLLQSCCFESIRREMLATVSLIDSSSLKNKYLSPEPESGRKRQVCSRVSKCI